MTGNKPRQAQLALPGIIIAPTISMLNGASLVAQCSWCGALVCFHEEDTSNLGPCPACKTEQWWAQSIPVGPFRHIHERRHSDPWAIEALEESQEAA